MKSLFKQLRELISTLINKGKRAEQLKAGKKWDSIVEELRNRN